MSTKHRAIRDARSDETSAARTDVATRRRFFVGAGAAALTAPIALGALAVGAAPVTVEAHDDGRAREHDEIAARLAALEDANAIRELQRAYARHVGAGAHAAAARLFADPTRAQFDDAIRGVALEGSATDAAIEIASDRRTAVARTACLVQVVTLIEGPGCTLVEMARAQGEGTVRRNERRSLEQHFVRRDGVWKISSSELTAHLREPAPARA
jgi:hypothetical protein